MEFEDSGIFFDDIGSYPLPKGIKLDGLSSDKYLDLVKEALAQKISLGVEMPTYPQFRDMIKMFLDLIRDPVLEESPYVIRKENAKILELLAVRPGQKIRVCVTGPLELYISVFGATDYDDILYRLARSTARFLQNARCQKKMAMASLDEPSLGISSNIIFEEDEIIKALEIASEPCKGLYCEAHLHSPLYAELCCHAPNINIVGVESAAHPDFLKLIDRKSLKETDTYLRAGIARTDILAMVAHLNDRLGINLWDDILRLEKEILGLESPEAMAKRLHAAFSLFGDRLKAVGPDCGLGSWPNRTIANGILANCAMTIKSFRKEKNI